MKSRYKPKSYGARRVFNQIVNFVWWMFGMIVIVVGLFFLWQWASPMLGLTQETINQDFVANPY